MKRIFAACCLSLAVFAIALPAMAQDAGELAALRKALEESLRENIALRAELEAARAEIDRLRGGALRPLSAVPVPTVAAARTHIVREGETLGILAAKYYGAVNAFTRIYDANRDVVADPDKIYPGQTLRIP